MDDSSTNTRHKALKLNLDASTYGTFAEIGGGQEVARWFFSVGGAAGTGAKTISAYDMAGWAGTYWDAPRYVRPQRVGGGPGHEVAHLLARPHRRRDNKRFFSRAEM